MSGRSWGEGEIERGWLCGETRTGGLDVGEDLVATGIEGGFDVESPEEANDTDPDGLRGEILTRAYPSAETETVVTLVECLCSDLFPVPGHEPLRLEGVSFRVEFLVVVDRPDVRNDGGFGGDSVALVEVLLDALVGCRYGGDGHPSTILGEQISSLVPLSLSYLNVSFTMATVYGRSLRCLNVGNRTPLAPKTLSISI